MKKLLMVAYHFPPLAGSSGIQRTLRFVQHLPAFGWEAVVLTVQAHAYERTSDELLKEVPRGTVVSRAFALDTARQLSFGRRYPGWLARPDRWVSWRFDGVRRGLHLIEQHRPHALWSTYPIATAHAIGAELQRRSGLPWIADFRDPMAQEGYPEDPRTWRSYEKLERTVMRAASACVFTTPGAARLYRERYPAARPRVDVIENGYDEESFSDLPPPSARPPAAPMVLLHSGIVYPSERDPTALFEALTILRRQHGVEPSALQLRFRAAVHDELLRSMAQRLGVQDFIELVPPIRYREALSEMLTVDGLLILQAANCNAQIPAKLYEYLRARRPLVGLTAPEGDTAGALRKAGVPYLAALDDAHAIARLLARLLDERRRGALTLPDASAVEGASRRARSQVLTTLLEDLT